MKRLMLISAVGVAVCLFSCRAQKATINTDRDSSLSYADTTKTVSDTSGHKAHTIDTTKTAATFEGSNVIEFVEGGGKVSIGQDGNVILDGVKNIKGQRKGSAEQDTGVTRTTEEAAGHYEQLNGVEADQTQHEKRTEEKASAQKWYETALARLGLGVCIAALMWLIFLYLKRKF